MIENDVYCDDILIQISAITNSIKSLGRVILNNHIKSCVKDELIKGNDEIIDEVINSFLNYIRKYSVFIGWFDKNAKYRLI